MGFLPPVHDQYNQPRLSVLLTQTLSNPFVAAATCLCLCYDVYTDYTDHVECDVVGPKCRHGNGEWFIEAVAKLRKTREVKLQASINIWRIDTRGPVLAACNPEMDKLKRMDGWDKRIGRETLSEEINANITRK